MTHCERVLNRLRQGPASHLELYRLGVIAHSRVSELRKRGYRIDQHREGDLYIYELGAEPVPQSGSPEKRGEGCQLPESAPTPKNWRWLLNDDGDADSPPSSLSSRSPSSPRRAHPSPADARRLLKLLPGGQPAHPAAGQLTLLGGGGHAAVNVNEGAYPGGPDGKGRVRSRTIQARDRAGVGGAHHVA